MLSYMAIPKSVFLCQKFFPHNKGLKKEMRLHIERQAMIEET